MVAFRVEGVLTILRTNKISKGSQEDNISLKNIGIGIKPRVSPGPYVVRRKDLP